MTGFFFKLLRYSGIYFIVRSLVSKNKVSIVLYHDPKPEVFYKHIKFLSNKYNFISLDLLVDAIHSKDWSNIPENSIVVTIDDGHSGNFKLLSTIKEFNVKPTIYCCSSIVGTNRCYWWKKVNSSQLQYYKELPNNLRLSELLLNYSFSNTNIYKDRQSLSHKEINEMKHYVSFQSHTRFHPILTCCSTKELCTEISDSRYEIESITGEKCVHFCYPNGDYNDEVIGSVKAAGYRSARTIDVGWNDLNTDPYKLKITGISDNASIDQVIAQLTGITMYMRYAFKGNFKGLYSPIKLKKKLFC